VSTPAGPGTGVWAGRVDRGHYTAGRRGGDRRRGWGKSRRAARRGVANGPPWGDRRPGGRTGPVSGRGTRAAQGGTDTAGRSAGRSARVRSPGPLGSPRRLRGRPRQRTPPIAAGVPIGPLMPEDCRKWLTAIGLPSYCPSGPASGVCNFGCPRLQELHGSSYTPPVSPVRRPAPGRKKNRQTCPRRKNPFRPAPNHSLSDGVVPHTSRGGRGNNSVCRSFATGRGSTRCSRNCLWWA
jgi:hypothetical protein